MRHCRPFIRWSTPLSDAARLTHLAIDDDHNLTVTITAELNGARELWLLTVTGRVDYSVCHHKFSQRRSAAIQAAGWTSLRGAHTRKGNSTKDMSQLLSSLEQSAGGLIQYRIVTESAVLDLKCRSVPELRRLARAPLAGVGVDKRFAE